MSDYANPNTGAADDEPTAPLLPSAGYQQPTVPEVEPTLVDPFSAPESTSPYPDFSYEAPHRDYSAPPATTAASHDSWGINPNPLMSPSNNAQPYAPATEAYPEPDPQPQPPAVTQYQQYPAVAVPAPPAPPLAYAAPQPYGYAPLPEHPSAIPALILGLLGLLLAVPLASPIAWYLGARGRRDLTADPGHWRPSGMLTAGYVLGIVGTLIGALFLGLIALAVVFD